MYFSAQVWADYRKYVRHYGAKISIKFAPGGGQLMQLACLCSHWTGPDDDLVPFAIVTNKPPPEVAAAGHDRCPVPLKPATVAAWLAAPTPADYQALLDDRERLYYAHQLAGAA